MIFGVFFVKQVACRFKTNLKNASFYGMTRAQCKFSEKRFFAHRTRWCYFMPKYTDSVPVKELREVS